MKAIVDRIEGDIAVLEIDATRYENVPLSELPEGTRQGDAFDGDGEPGHWARDDAYKAERTRINDDLRRKLFK